MSNELILKTGAVIKPLNRQIKAESGDVLLKIRKALQIKMRWVRAIALSCFLGFVFIQGEIRLWLFSMFLIYEAGRYLMLYKLKALKDVDYTRVTSEVLHAQLHTVKQALKVEQIWGYLIIPISGPFGLIAVNIYKGKSFSMVMGQPNMIYILCGLFLLSLPLIWLAGKMNHIAFGKYIQKLQDNIMQIEA